MMVIRNDGMHDVNDLPIEEQMEARRSMHEFINSALGEEQKSKEQATNTLMLNTQWGSTEQVQLQINQYLNNGCIYIGLVTNTEAYPEPYGDLTVNLAGKAPDYCGYVDLNNMPELEKFIAENDLGEFTGLTQRSGFCEYPLYLFNVDKLRELCPDGMQAYEASIGKVRDVKIAERAR